jgi:tetratricopeptide (TPR) repeat protein
MKMKLQRMNSRQAVARVCQEAKMAWHRKDYPQYFKIMERVSRENPADTGILLDIAAAYGMRYEYATAESWFERALRVAPSRSNALVMAATQCRGFDRFEMARTYFERAIKEPDASTSTFVKLAEVYERFRMLDQASELVDRALSLAPADPLATLVRARLDRTSGRREEAERRLRPLLALSDNDSWSTRIRGWYEMGMVLDGQGRYDEAMSAFLEAKKLILPNAAQHIANQKMVHARLKITEEKLNAEMVSRWKAQEPASEPCRLALLCGHPRSGTTLLEQVLDSHPGFVSAEETRIFSQEAYNHLLRDLPPRTLMVDALESVSSETLRQARQNYAGCMARFLGHPPDARMLIDKNPSLTGLVPAFVRVFPEAKLLVALRDPRDVCLSCFMQPLPLGQVSAIFLSLETTVLEYASTMGLWRAAAPCLGGSYMEVRYEDVVADLEGVSRRALEYLGAGWDERVLRFNEYAGSKLVRSPTYNAVAKPISKGAVGRWRNYQKYLEPHLDTLAPLLKAFGYE